MPLTDITIRTTKPSTKPVKLFDSGGLYLLLNPNASRWWRLDYRFSSKRKTLSLGVYPDVSLKDARNRRDEARKLLANGIDPSAHRKAAKAARIAIAANSFEIIACEWYAKHEPNWAQGHSSRVMGRLERDVFPWLGHVPIADITPPELLAVLRRVENRGALETAHRVLSICGQIFRYAIATGRASRDISQDLRGALPPTKGNHFQAVTDPKKVGELLRTLDGYQGTFVVQCALRLAPLVFVRPGELRHAQWEDIDLEAAEWRFTASKTDASHIVPLSRQSLTILRELQPLTGRGLYVFPSARNPRGDRPMSDNAILSALRRMGIAKEEMSGHGFRAMARTILDEVLGFRPDYIEHQLAHAVRDPHGRAYNRTAHLPERRKMMQTWADYLDGLRIGVEVVSINGRH